MNAQHQKYTLPLCDFIVADTSRSIVDLVITDDLLSKDPENDSFFYKFHVICTSYGKSFIF